MKKITFAICTLLFISCNQFTKKSKIAQGHDINTQRRTEVVKDIGINQQLLNAIDSITHCRSKDSIITIDFTIDTCSQIIIIRNCMVIPVPQKPGRTLISQWDNFIGYKKYKNRTLVFLKYENYNNTYSNFLNKDSLKFDEEPFRNLNIDNVGEINDEKPQQIIFRVIDKDSLLLLDEKDWPFYLK